MARKLIGTVASDAQDKTIVVTVARHATHPLYGKRYVISKRFAAHDEENAAHKGDKVEIVESRPYSKRKTWRLNQILETAQKVIEVAKQEEV